MVQEDPKDKDVEVREGCLDEVTQMRRCPRGRAERRGKAADRGGRELPAQGQFPELQIPPSAAAAEEGGGEAARDGAGAIAGGQATRRSVPLAAGLELIQW